MSYQKAIELLQQGEFESARSHLLQHPLDFKTANLLGIIGQLQQDWAAAKIAWTQASEMAPDNLDVRLNLGIACMALNQKSEAAYWWQSILAMSPRHPQSLINLGLYYRERDENLKAHEYWSRAAEETSEHVQLQEWLADVKGVIGIGLLVLGRVAEAEAYLKDAVLLDPMYPILWGYLSEWHFKQTEFGEALATCNKAIQLDDENHQFYHTRGNILRALGDDEAALEAYQRARSLGGKHISTLRAIAELTEQCIEEDEDVVALLFDQYATTFDEQLQTKLRYAVPAAVQRVVTKMELLQSPPRSVVDLGCGTGLSLEPLMSFLNDETSITGVDLSENMLEVAARKELYTDLRHCSMQDYFQQSEDPHDLILCLDTLVYCLELRSIFRSVSDRLMDGGVFIFSTERSESESVRLQRTGRYAHSVQHITELLNETSLGILHMESLNLRKDSDRWVKGNLWMVKKV